MSKRERREFTKELIEKCIAAINELPNCPNGHSDVYDKATIERVLKNVIDQVIAKLAMLVRKLESKQKQN